MTQEDMDYVQANPFQESVKNYPELPVTPNSFTCIFDDEIVAVGGLHVMWEGRGEVWVMLTKQAKKDGVFGLIALYAIQEKMEELIAKHSLWRTECHARCDFEKANKFIKALGFKFECVKRKYGLDKSDMNSYVMVRE